MEYKGLILSDFQIEAIEGINRNENVIVATHTGNGKTLVADYAVAKCRNEGKKVVYTAPIKALSNQKYSQFKKEFGEENVGLITGDRVINDSAPILVMTTEILRNMMHEDPDKVDNIKYIIFDEIHYLKDEDRGTVWEESIIFKNKNSKIIGLSATIPNINEICDWIELIHDEKVTRVFYPERIVKQKHYYFDKKLGPCDKKAVVKNFFTSETGIKYITSHVDFIGYASKEKILPVLFFVFSRRQCEEKAFELAHIFDFLDRESKNEVQKLIDAHEEKYPILQNMHSWLEMKNTILNGICYHHAGLLPIIKEIVENLFEKKLIQVLYATETFAVGINYPVKTTCFSSMRKFDGKNFRNLSGSEYLQMSGRAGRRGIDDFGCVYTLVDYKFFEKSELLELSSVTSEEVKSQFKLSYNTILNLASRYTKDQINAIFRKSLANYQYLRILNERHEELEKKRKIVEKFSNENKNKNSCKHLGSVVCPVERIKLQEEQRRLVNLSRKRGLPSHVQTQINQELGELNVKLKNVKFNKCSKRQLRACASEVSNIQELKRTVKKIEKSLIKLTNQSPEHLFSIEFDEKLELLRQFEYIDNKNNLLARGKTCSKIHVQELFVTELIFEGLFHDLDEDILNAVVAGIVFENDRMVKPSFNFDFDYSNIHKIMGNILKREQKMGLEFNTTFIENACPIIYAWSKGATLEEIATNADMLEGDFVALCRRVIDLFRQIKNANLDDKFLVEKVNRCIKKLFRDVVEMGL